MPALLDTGSPITVMNAQAARLQGGVSPTRQLTKIIRWQPYSPFQQARLPPVYILTIFAGGIRVNLRKSTGEVKCVDGTARMVRKFSSSGPVYVGTCRLAALNGLGVESPPAVVLVERCSDDDPALLRATENEAWF
jgi:hypothetical protein